MEWTSVVLKTATVNISMICALLTTPVPDEGDMMLFGTLKIQFMSDMRFS
jgi:hypothetical protein